MPEGAAPQRSDEMAAMASVLHARRTDPRLGDWLAAAEPADETEAANLRHIARDFERSQRLPARLAAEIARITSKSHRIWAQARADEDVAAFLPILGEVLELQREAAAALAGKGTSLYDALLDDYEPGARSADIAAIFVRLRAGLVPLREAVLAATPAPVLTGSYDEAAQMALSSRLALAFGYDLGHGRIDTAIHPFSAGSGLDVRITTRTNPDDPFNCFYSTIHETGHATYEQNIDGRHLLTPVGHGASMGVHESQSRIYENQLGRSRAFTAWLYGEMRAGFGDFGIASPEDFYRCVNAVQRGYIRTEADELQYNLHVMLRFDLERALIAGDLQVGDLEAAWNDRFAADFGYPVDTPSTGLLQDVHWSAGLFGYFPTYALGNVYSGCLHAALRADLPDLDASLARGDVSPATGWLGEKVQQYGGLREAPQTIGFAVGHAPTEAPLLAYLTEKFSDLYGL